MADYRSDFEEGLKRSMISDSRLRLVVSNINTDRSDRSGVRHKVKRRYQVATLSVVLVLVVSFFPLAADILRTSMLGSNHSTEVLPMDLTLDKNENYTGFSSFPLIDSVDDAMNAGYIVSRDSVIVANEERWRYFIETATAGRNVSARIYIYSTKADTGSAIYDLYFFNGHYYLFDSTSNQLKAQPFSFLLTLEGQFGNPKKDSWVVVLTNDRALTFDTVIKSLLSSNMDFKKSVSPYQLVLFDL